MLAALGRASAFGRWRASDVRSILAAGAGAPEPREPGHALVPKLPRAPTRSLADYVVPGTDPGTDAMSGGRS